MRGTKGAFFVGQTPNRVPPYRKGGSKNIMGYVGREIKK